MEEYYSVMDCHTTTDERQRYVGKIVGMMRRMVWCGVLAVTVCGAMRASVAWGQELPATSGPWVMEKSGSTAGLRGIHAVGGGVAWASGTNGTVLRTEDGGYEWQSCAMPPGAEKLDFRGIWAWDDNTAMVMASGTGDASRIYETKDGCSSWKLLFTNPDKDGFWDAMVFLNRDRGYLLGDPVRGKFAFFTTKDGGTTWARSDAASLASGPEATGAFAASNSSLLGRPNEPVAFGTGGALYFSQSFRMTIRLSTNSGPPVPPTEQWNRAAAPLANQGEAAGIFSLGFHEGPVHGYGYTLVAVGGDYTKPNESTGTAAWSTDGGKTWTAATKPPHGYRSAVAWDADAKAWIAAGTNGSDISYDDGKTWVSLDNGNWNALSLPWVVGPSGRIAKLDPGKLPRSGDQSGAK
jgi:photosystem II stability/assembly factor-like uncharacterized protein